MAEKYKLLLVDDEEDVRQAIIARLDWDSLGFVVAGEASNGEEALELAERVEPDVIMTDIRMPFMDGLELCRRVRSLLPGTRMAILSGFDEFEYAREALSQQVEDYVLKPIDAAELSKVFSRIRHSLDEEIAGRRDLERLRRRYAESLPLLRQQALSDLLIGSQPPGSIAPYFAEYDIDIAADGYCVAALRYDQEEIGPEEQLRALSMQQLIEETLEGKTRFYLLRMPNRFVVMFFLEKGATIRSLSEQLHPLFPQAKKLLGMHLHIGIGEIYARPEDLRLSYEEACAALEYQYLLEGGQCIYIGDIEPGDRSAEMPDPQYAEEILRQIKIGDAETLRRAIGGLTSHLRAVDTGPQQYQIYLLELIAGLLRLIRTYRMDEAEARQKELLAEGVTLRLTDLDALGEWLFSYCENLQQLARRERKDSMRLLIERAQEILIKSYADSELSLDQVCAQLSVSPAYFSTLFKRETGQGFVGYLTSLRMDRALELLRTTDDKTYEIAEKIGYADPNYFSYVFKKRFGVSPSRYRAAQAGV